MIEVEKKFQPTEEQIKKLLEGAESLGTKIIHDIYFDYPDYRLLKDKIRLRNRNGFFELKLVKIDGACEASDEIENEEDIKKYFKIDKNLEEFIKDDLIIVSDFINERQKYKKGEFNIDIDKMNFGYNLCEIELMVGKEEEMREAEEKIMKLARDCDFEIKKLNGKTAEYLRLLKPEIYKQVYG